MDHPCHMHGRAAPGQQPMPEAVGDAAFYTCPMHPEVRQLGPGLCPICGMSLEPEIAGSDHDGGELADMTRRLWVSIMLALPVIILEMGGHFGFMPLTHKASNIVQFALATPVVIWGAGLSSRAACDRFSAGASICSRSSPWVPAPRTSTASSLRRRRVSSHPRSATRTAESPSISKLP